VSTKAGQVHIEHPVERHGYVITWGTCPIKLPLYTTLKQRVEDNPKFRQWVRKQHRHPWCRVEDRSEQTSLPGSKA